MKKRRENYNIKKREKRKKKKAMKNNVLSTLSNAFPFGESITIEFQKQSEIS